MKRSVRLAIVVDLAKKEEEKAARFVGELTQQLQLEQNKLTDLQTYYTEYETKFLERRTGVRAEELISGRNFLGQLSEALKVQSQHITHFETQLEKAKQIWHQLHLRYDNLVSLVERIKKQENYELDKQEQKLIDEWVSQNSARIPVE